MSYLKKFLLPLLLITIALSLRLYHLPLRAVFSGDEEYQATYAKTIVDDFHPVWIGVSASDTGIYLGPYFTYFTSLLLYLSHGDPLFTNYIAAMIGAITTYLIFTLGVVSSGYYLGSIAALFYAFSPLMIHFDQRYWNPNPIPFLCLLLLISLQKIAQNRWWLLVTACCIGMFWHVHLSLIPLVLVAAVAIYHYRQKITLRVWLISGLILFASSLPLMIFNYYHQASNLTAPYKLLTSQAGNSAINFLGNTQILGNTLARSLYLKPGGYGGDEIRPGCNLSISTNVTPFIALIALIPLFVSVSPLVDSAKLIMVLSFIFYPQAVSGYYALGLLPLYFLSLAKLFLKQKYLGYLVLGVIIFVSLRTIFLSNESYGLLNKQRLIKHISTYLGSKPYSLTEVGTCHHYGGWRYLFTVYSHPPSSSSADPSLGWLYPKEITGESEYQVVIGPTTEYSWSSNSLVSFTEGSYTAQVYVKK